MARILWIADGGAATGFARVTHAIGDRLVEQYGHEVHVLATNFRGDPYPTKVEMYVPTYHNKDDTYGRSRFLELAGKLVPDVVVILNDPQVVHRHLLENRYDPDMLLAKHFPVLTYIPIDGHNQPLLYSPLAQLTNRVAMSKFGMEQMPEAQLVYHGVDTDQFWPIATDRPITTSKGEKLTSKKDCKRAFGIPADSFLVGRVDRNTGRKDFAATWKALQPVMKRHSDVVAYFHCKAKNELSGTNLAALFSRDLETMSRFRVPGERFDSHVGYSQQDLNAIYNAMDVFVSTSRGEGFGLTIAEALACGIPVIAQNVSATPEVVGPGGELIEPQREITVPFGQDQWLADIDAFSEAIEYAYNHRRWRREKGAAGREHVTATFQWDVEVEKFNRLINALAERPSFPERGAGQEEQDDGQGQAAKRAPAKRGGAATGAAARRRPRG